MTCAALWQALASDVLLVDEQLTPQRWTEIAIQFEQGSNIPLCVGAINGKHVVIQAPPNSGPDFYNYKGTFSIVLMTMCDADYYFTIVDIGARGRQSDGVIFRSSEMCKRVLSQQLYLPPDRSLGVGGVHTLPHYFVADAAFPLVNNLHIPETNCLKIVAFSTTDSDAL